MLFTFFNPSQNIQTTHATTLTYVTIAGIMVWAIGWGMFGGPHPPGDAFAGGIAGFLLAFSAGPLLGWLCYVAVTSWRWGSGRFKGDGRLYVAPWQELEAFQVVGADEAGAARSERSPPGGHGLIAAFANHAPSFPLTANFWNYESIAEKHRLLTKAFIEQRGPLLTTWHEKRKRLAEMESEPEPVPSKSKAWVGGGAIAGEMANAQQGIQGTRLGGQFSHDWTDQEPMIVTLKKGDQVAVHSPTGGEKPASIAVDRSAWIEMFEGELYFALVGEEEVEVYKPWDLVRQFEITDYRAKFGDSGLSPYDGELHAIAMDPTEGDPWRIAVSIEGAAALRECRAILEDKFGPDARAKFLRAGGIEAVSPAPASTSNARLAAKSGIPTKL